MRGGRGYAVRGTMRGAGTYRSSGSDGRNVNSNRPSGGRYGDNHYNGGGVHSSNRGGGPRYYSSYAGGGGAGGSHYDSRSRDKFNSSVGGGRHDTSLHRRTYRDESRDRNDDRKRLRQDDYRRTNATGRGNRTPPPPPPGMASASNSYRSNIGGGSGGGGSGMGISSNTYRNQSRIGPGNSGDAPSRYRSSMVGSGGPNNRTPALRTSYISRTRGAGGNLGGSGGSGGISGSMRRPVLRGAVGINSGSRIQRESVDIRIMRRKLLYAQQKDRARVLKIARLTSSLRRSRLERRSKSPRHSRSDKAAKTAEQSSGDEDYQRHHKEDAKPHRNKDDEDDDEEDNQEVNNSDNVDDETKNDEEEGAKTETEKKKKSSASSSATKRSLKRQKSYEEDATAERLDSTNTAAEEDAVSTAVERKEKTTETREGAQDSDDSEKDEKKDSDSKTAKDKDGDEDRKKEKTKKVTATITVSTSTTSKKRSITSSHTDEEPRKRVATSESRHDVEDDGARRNSRFIKLTCIHCHSKCVTFKEYSNHLYSYRHKNALHQVAVRQKAYLLRLRALQRIAQREIEQKSKEEYEPKFCHLCRLHYRQPKAKHQLSEHHKAMKKFLMPYCSACHIAFKSPMMFETHRCSLDHIRIKARRGDSESESESELGMRKIDLNKFLTVDSVGEIDLDIVGKDAILNDEDEADEIDDELVKGEIQGDIGTDGENVGSEFIKSVKTYYCELCGEYAVYKETLDVFLRKHCSQRNHLKLCKRLKEDEEKLNTKVEEPKKETEENATEEIVKKADDTEKQETEIKEVAAVKVPEITDEDLDEEKLWADVDKDLGDLLAVVSTEVQDDDDEEEDESVLNIDIESEKPKLKELNGKKDALVISESVKEKPNQSAKTPVTILSDDKKPVNKTTSESPTKVTSPSGKPRLQRRKITTKTPTSVKK